FAAIGRKLCQNDSLAGAVRRLRRSAGYPGDAWVASDPVKAVCGFEAADGKIWGPSHAGSGHVALHARLGAWHANPGGGGAAVGGMGASTQAMARAAGEHGVRIDIGSEVREVLVERSRAAGVVLKNCTAVRARAVVANVNPQMLFQALVPQDAVPAAAAKRMKAWKAGSGTFRMNVALSRLAEVFALPGIGDHHTAGIILAPSPAYMYQT